MIATQLEQDCDCAMNEGFILKGCATDSQTTSLPDNCLKSGYCQLAYSKIVEPLVLKVEMD